MTGTKLLVVAYVGGGSKMKAIDRVMRAYRSVRNLSDEEAARVRAELSDFIQKLLLGNLPRKPPT